MAPSRFIQVSGGTSLAPNASGRSRHNHFMPLSHMEHGYMEGITWRLTSTKHRPLFLCAQTSFCYALESSLRARCTLVKVPWPHCGNIAGGSQRKIFRAVFPRFNLRSPIRTTKELVSLNCCLLLILYINTAPYCRLQMLYIQQDYLYFVVAVLDSFKLLMCIQGYVI